MAVARRPNRIVVKVGSSLLVDGDGTRRDWLTGLVDEIAARRRDGTDIILVSSGAIALGALRLGLTKRGRASLEDAQASAATGQITLAGLWAQLLGARGMTAAQMLITLGDLEDRRRYLNVCATLGRLLALGVVPVVNENDTVATEEIRFGDNDRLAARVAVAARAHLVVLLSDVDGLYTADPMGNPGAKRIERVDRVDETVTAMASAASGSGLGTGGMAAKIEAARIATRAGIDLVIASGHEPRPLARIAPGVGTWFVADRAAPSRKGWLSGRATVAGRVMVDAGAARALAEGASLLAAGMTGVDGGFVRGDVVDVVAQGQVLARGLIEYDAGDLALILGRRREEIGSVLGYAPRSAVVHRDNLVLL